MNFKELLIAQGITEEQASKIIEAMPANKLYIASEENLDIRFNKAKTELEQAKADLSAANKLVEDLKKSNADVELGRSPGLFPFFLTDSKLYRETAQFLL